jgi:hypothetical protein
MSFEIHKEPQVHGSAEQQLLLQIEHLKRTVKSPHDLIEHVIQLYGAEFVKANAALADERKNAEIAAARAEQAQIALAEQQRANDELFRIKQRVVIANRDLIRQVGELQARLGLLPVLTDALREAQARVENEVAITVDANAGHALTGFARDLKALCEFVERYDEAMHKPMDAAALEAHKRKAEDTPA